MSALRKYAQQSYTRVSSALEESWCNLEKEFPKKEKKNVVALGVRSTLPPNLTLTLWRSLSSVTTSDGFHSRC